MWKSFIGSFFNTITSFKIIQKTQCQSCNLYGHNSLSKLNVSVEDIHNTSLSKLIIQTLLLPVNKERPNNFCGNTHFLISEFSLNSIVCLDVENNDNSLVNLDNLGSTIKIGKTKFVLVGVISFEEAMFQNDFRHYAACCRDFYGSWKKWDSKIASKKAVTLTVDKQWFKAALIIYFEYQ